MSTRPIIINLVQDATPATPDFLRRLTRPLLEEGFAGSFGRQLPRPWTNKIERIFLERTYHGVREVRSCSDQEALEIKSIFFSNVCSAIRRDVWERIPFDESLEVSRSAINLARLNAGNNMAARMAMMAITTRSSIRVKARCSRFLEVRGQRSDVRGWRSQVKAASRGSAIPDCLSGE